MASFKKKDFAGALKEWQPLAEQGDPMAANALGALYDRGLGVKEDDAEAAKWYEKAAEGGIPLAMRNIGTLYSTGQGVPYDMAKARYWFEKAAALGDKPAIRRLAFINHTPLPPEEPAPDLALKPSPVSVASASTEANPSSSVLLASNGNPSSTKDPAKSSSSQALGTVQSLPDKPIQPAPPPNGPIGPAVKAVPVPKVQEASLPSPTPATKPVAEDIPAPPPANANVPPEQSPTLAATTTAPETPVAQQASSSPNWLLGQWQGPSLGCPPQGGIEFTSTEADTYFNGKVEVRLKAIYQVSGDIITVTTVGLDGMKQDYVYRRTQPDRFVIDKVPSSMPSSLVGAEHKKCSL